MKPHRTGEDNGDELDGQRSKRLVVKVLGA
jgi:hypothetical protein